MNPRLSSRLGAAALAGAVAIVPVAGAIAVAQPAAAASVATPTARLVVADDAVAPLQPVSEDIAPISEEIAPISEEIAPISADVEEPGAGFPWILAANLVGATVVVGGALIVMHRNDKRLGRR
jgi:hypothetical protein